jgi:hypothetical protein
MEMPPLLGHSDEFARKAVFAAAALLALAVVVIGIFLAVNFKIHLPSVPIRQASESAADFKADIENFKDLTQAMQSNSTAIFELSARPMLTIFTSVIATIVSYLFAKTILTFALLRRRQDDERESV